MRELTFFTSNQTKLAHARYLAEGRQFRIKGFRQRTYHAGYVEPRLDSRSEILEASYLSAKEQIHKAGYSEASHPFILEDTSVRIDALSSSDREIPGVDIKYWMEGRSFEQLDYLLRSAGNNRNVTVRSDVLLHIPTSNQRAWGVEGRSYLIFTGEQSGTIVESEREFESNLVYPWLDNKSFNKWFQPHGCDAPLGSLRIDDANRVDFRRKSFEKLFNFLDESRYSFGPSGQMEFPLDQKPSFIICGFTCAGKTAASQHLAKAFGYLHVEASDFMYLSYYYRHGYRGEISIGDFAEDALKQKPTIAAERVLEYIADNLAEPIVVSGFRAPFEIEYLKSEMALYGKTFVTRFIDADERVRFERMQKRARPGDNLSIQEFRNRDQQQERMGLSQIKRGPDVNLSANMASLAQFELEVDDWVGAGREDEINIRKSLQNAAHMAEIGLEDAILIALLSVWKNDEAREFYTTTQISKLISVAFPRITPKHKDNVSRYFNQDYYVFYEISRSDSREIRRFRLSNTGYGMAIRTLRRLFR